MGASRSASPVRVKIRGHGINLRPGQQRNVTNDLTLDQTALYKERPQGFYRKGNPAPQSSLIPGQVGLRGTAVFVSLRHARVLELFGLKPTRETSASMHGPCRSGLERLGQWIGFCAAQSSSTEG
jgi:hypothetical protein